MKKENTHIVIKRKDVLEYLEESEQIALEEMINKIVRGRAKSRKKPVNEYYIVNKDEPYAEVVHGIIIGGEADLYLDNLLKTVKKKGILVETLEKGTSFVFEKRTQYKKDLGAVPVKDIFGNITNVYQVYEDYDGSIKYYDYPQFSKRNSRRKLIDC